MPRYVDNPQNRRLGRVGKEYGWVKSRSPARKSPPRKSPARRAPVRRSPPKKSPPRGYKGKKVSSGCKVSYTKKYSERNSPPYPANECCGATKWGNDGNLYISVEDRNGVCKWKRN